MDLRKLKTLIDLVSESGIAEIEITEGESRVRIVNRPNAAPALVAPAAAVAVAAAPVQIPEAAEGEPEEPAKPAKTINSPMVGTFYRAPSPGAKPFVEVGQRVRAGETVCIIEAMKLLNEIEAECDGVIEEVLVDNGDPVEFGQALFVIA
ncbi:MAG: acetyl-CoA carboxylase biotin carboxyl carrier protein [Duodenibacillus sp.]|nr:acetyl-CoA carboxylase biotin carboxyl carrier protein [Duodenibacillus sp.]